MGKILVIGSLNQDFVIDTEKMPRSGETVLGKGVTLVPGGKGANQAYAAGRLGGSVSMIGAVGQDIYGENFLENLQGADVDTSGIEVLADAETGKAFITVDAQGNNSITVIQGANARVSIDMIDRHVNLIEECDTVILQMEIPMETVIYVIRLAQKKNKRIILDPAPAPKAFPKDFFQGIDIVKPNETELQSIIGEKCNTRKNENHSV